MLALVDVQHVSSVFGDLEKNQLIKISIKSKVKVATIRIAIDKKIN